MSEFFTPYNINDQIEDKKMMFLTKDRLQTHTAEMSISRTRRERSTSDVYHKNTTEIFSKKKKKSLEKNVIFLISLLKY